MTSSIEDTLTDLVSTYSPTGYEEKAIEKFIGYLEEVGAKEIDTDVAGNGYGIFPGKGVSVTLCGHIDTVPGELPVVNEDGILRGRGAVDAKSSLVSLLYGAKLAKDRGFHGTLFIIAAVGEEGPGKGIIEVARSHKKTDYAILGEPSGTTGITAGYRGRLLLDLSFQTKSFHASAPWMGENAVDMAIESWRRIKETYGENREFSKVSAALTSFHGGTADNVTPAESTLTLDVRFPPSRKRETLLGELETFLLKGNSDANLSINVRSYVDPYVSNLKTPLVNAFKNSISEIAKESPKTIFKSGSGDMNILGDSWRIPCITYGPGNPQLSHTVDEEIEIAEVERSAQIVADALLRLEKLHSN